jgi:hypothetical protein
MGRHRCVFVGLAMLLALVMSSPGEVEAQARGTVTGRVLQQGSMRPLAGAQVSIPGTGWVGWRRPTVGS